MIWSRVLPKKLYLYLLKELGSLFFLSLLIFTFILVVSRLGRMADLVINKGVDLTDIVLLILYSFPAYLTFTFPMAFLLSTIVVLGRLSSENEILALKANGIKYIVAKSFSRIFYRNMINLGLLPIVANTDNISEGQQLEVDIKARKLVNKTTGETQTFDLPPLVEKFFSAGGLVHFIQKNGIAGLKQFQ